MAAARISIFFFALSLFPASSALPWGGAHSLVNRYAVDNLPPEMVDDGSDNAFGDMRGYLSDHASDPDSQKDTDPLEEERHWCDIDSKIDEYPPPFTSVPRDYTIYCSVFGRDNGVIQWEGIRDHYENLVALMCAREWATAYQRAAELGHYVADATCPLHATANYDGQLSPDGRNSGIHGRYEGMADMYISVINTTPNSVTIVEDPLELGFGILAEGQQLVNAIMAADLAAQDQTGSNESAEYYQALFNIVGSDAQIRLDLASKRLADLWYTAWVEAGRPPFFPLPPLVIDLGWLLVVRPFTLGISLNEDITTPFDYYLLADTPAGVYTIYLNGAIKAGITPIYKNVGRFDAPFSTTVRPSVIIPLSMKGKTITFYTAVIEAGMVPPVRNLDELRPCSRYVIMMDKKTVAVAP